MVSCPLTVASPCAEVSLNAHIESGAGLPAMLTYATRVTVSPTTP